MLKILVYCSFLTITTASIIQLARKYPQYFKEEDETIIDEDNVISEIMKYYPGALRDTHFITQLYDVLHSYSKTFCKNTLLATSFCSDEINRIFENKLASKFGGSSFSMGGLSGFPFAGITGFTAFSHHIPTTDGSAVIVFGPHIGIDDKGQLGKINRRGIEVTGNCCGSAMAALSKFKESTTNVISTSSLGLDLDIQQNEVLRSLYEKCSTDKLINSNFPLKELPIILFEKQKKMIIKIITSASKNNLPENSRLALVGGIHINTPSGMNDFFLPMMFEVRDCNGELLSDLLKK